MSFAFPRKRKKRAADLVHHFNLRCMERIGIVIPQEELKRRMDKHQLSVVRRRSNTRTLFLVPKDLLPIGHTREIMAVYDKKRHNFVTVLFKDGGYDYDTTTIG